MSRVFGFLANLWNALLGRSRVPRDHDELWRHGEQAGADIGRLEAAQQRSGSNGLVDHPPAERIILGVVAARIASISQRLARRFNRIVARAERWRRKAQRLADRAETLRDARPEVEPKSRAIEPFVSKVLIYLLTFGLVVLTLETSGMWTSLAAYDGIIGDLRIPMSIAAGAILVLAGHGMGHLLWGAVEEHDRRSALLAGALAVLVIGILSVIWLGTGRDANTRAADRFAESGRLNGRAGELEREARNLLTPLAVDPDEALPPEPSAEDRREGERLNAEAEDVRDEATLREEEAREGRTLDFFALVQILGLAVGTIGGYYFAAAAPVREFKRLTKRASREDRRATRRFSRAEAWQAKADDMLARVGRLVTEEIAWGNADLGHHEQTRLIARGFPVAASRAPGHAAAAEDIQALVERSIRPADLNGHDPGTSKASDSKED